MNFFAGNRLKTTMPRSVVGVINISVIIQNLIGGMVLPVNLVSGIDSSTVVKPNEFIAR
jgi:hypothetical protein